MSGDGTTDNLLLPGDMVLSKDAILKALAKPSVWGVGNKKRAVLLALVTNRDALLDRVGEASQDQRATLEKLIPIAEKTVRNPRFKVVKVVEHIYEIAIILDAYHSSPFSRAMRSDPLNQTFANISSMMRQARQDGGSINGEHSDGASKAQHGGEATDCRRDVSRRSLGAYGSASTRHPIESAIPLAEAISRRVVGEES